MFVGDVIHAKLKFIPKNIAQTHINPKSHGYSLLGKERNTSDIMNVTNRFNFRRQFEKGKAITDTTDRQIDEPKNKINERTCWMLF